MTRKIFNNIVIVSIFTFLSCLIIVVGGLYRFFQGKIVEEIHQEAGYIGRGLEEMGISYLDGISTTARITWIAEDGSVIYDTDANAGELENHKDREEIKEAFRDGTGEAMRYSDTLLKKTMYYAILQEDGTVLRVSNTQESIWRLLFEMLQIFLLVFIICIILSAVVAFKLAKRITTPINEIDIENPDIDEEYEEIAPLIRRIHIQNKMIKSQMKEIQRKQEEFTSITNNMSEGFVVIDKMTHVLSYNSAAADYLGITEDMEVKSIYNLNRDSSLRTAVEHALAGNNNVQLVKKESKMYNIISNTVYHNGSIEGAIIVTIDVTEKELREKLRREFTSNVSHELKTPLTSIYGMSDLLAQNMVKEEDVSEFGKNIHAEAKRLVSLVDDILRISQLDEGILDEVKVDIDLYDECRNIIKRLSPIAKENNISIELIGEHVKIKGAQNVIEEMIYNLCDNAIKYNRTGGHITINVYEENHHAIISVEDTGIGIPDTLKDRIFERFFRVDKSHSKIINGTGLGLAIVKHGAACHDANITVESTLDVGTTITITF